LFAPPPRPEKYPDLLQELHSTTIMANTFGYSPFPQVQEAALQLLDALLSRTQEPLADAVAFVLQLAPTFVQHANKDCTEVFLQILKGLWQRLAAEPGARVAVRDVVVFKEGGGDDKGSEQGRLTGLQEQLHVVELLLFVALAGDEPGVLRAAVEFWDQVLPQTPYERLEVRVKY
jgi:hypothetical protein